MAVYIACPRLRTNTLKLPLACIGAPCKAWGLAVRGEKALRAISPHWERLEERGWGGLAADVCLLAACTMGDKCDLGPSSKVWTGASAIPLLQLMTSLTATHLKAAAVPTKRLDAFSSQQFVAQLQQIIRPSLSAPLTQATRQAVTEARTSIFFLLVPRVAFLTRAAVSVAAASSGADKAEALIQASVYLPLVTTCSDIPLCPKLYLAAFSSNRVLNSLLGILEEAERAAWLSRGDMLRLSNCSARFTVCFAARVHHLASLGCEGAPVGSAQLRDLLAQPVLCLLESPLLDQLAMLQHALTVLVPLDSSYRPLHLPALAAWDVTPGPSPDTSQAGPGESISLFATATILLTLRLTHPCLILLDYSWSSLISKLPPF